MKPQDVAIIKREVEVIQVPYGQSLHLLPGTEVLVTQSLGGSFTLNVNGNLVRLEGKDADAIGREPVVWRIPPLTEVNGTVSLEPLWEVLKTCYDPEIPVNIVELGLIYDLSITPLEEGYHVGVQMTLTAPGCGMGPVLTQEIEQKLMQVGNVKKVDVVLVFDPPWNSDRMSEAAKLELGVF